MQELERSQTLSEVAADVAEDHASPRAVTSLLRRHAPLASAAYQLRVLSEIPLERDGVRVEFGDMARPDLTPAALEIFQVNLGKLCNMACRHCHVDAGPDRTDAMMSDATVDQVISALRASNAHTVDITGGAPELHPRFRDLVEASVAAGKHVMDRCNLTILLVPRNAGLIDWLAERRVEIVASLPHYRRPSTDSQRGAGVYDKSIRAMKLLNAAGYGKGDPALRLTLVSNPAGAFLGASQATLEREWRQSLERRPDRQPEQRGAAAGRRPGRRPAQGCGDAVDHERRAVGGAGRRGGRTGRSRRRPRCRRLRGAGPVTKRHRRVGSPPRPPRDEPEHPAVPLHVSSTRGPFVPCRNSCITRLIRNIASCRGVCPGRVCPAEPAPPVAPRAARRRC